MSRVAKKPVSLPKGVEVSLEGQNISVKGSKGSMTLEVHQSVQIVQEDGVLRMQPQSDEAKHRAMAGTMRALVNNMVVGVSQGFERKLQLVGVGYRCQLQGRSLNLSLGFSHPVIYEAPEGITLEAPSPTEVVVKGYDKQQVGAVAAKLRSFRPPEPYKGKGVRYADETIVLKEAKKK